MDYSKKHWAKDLDALFDKARTRGVELLEKHGSSYDRYEKAIDISEFNMTFMDEHIKYLVLIDSKRLAEVSPIYIITESNRQYPMTWLAYLDYLDYYIAIDALEAICKE